MKRNHVMIAVMLTVGALVASLVAYPQLPDLIPIHWNIYGKVDGYGDKQWAVFLFPSVMALMLALFLAIPWLSPKPFSVDSFRSTYAYVALVTIGLFAYLHAVTLWAQVNHPVDIGRPLVGGIFLFFAVLGNVMGKVRRNFWMGVRTPWTLANERVWNDTHRLAARLFVAVGVGGCVATMAGVNMIVSFVLLIVAALVPCVYSLIEYKQLERRGEV